MDKSSHFSVQQLYGQVITLALLELIKLDFDHHIIQMLFYSIPSQSKF